MIARHVLVGSRRCEEVRFVKGRLAFVPESGEATGAPFPSSVIVLLPVDDKRAEFGAPFLRLWDVPAEERR